MYPISLVIQCPWKGVWEEVVPVQAPWGPSEKAPIPENQGPRMAHWITEGGGKLRVFFFKKNENINEKKWLEKKKKKKKRNNEKVV